MAHSLSTPRAALLPGFSVSVSSLCMLLFSSLMSLPLHAVQPTALAPTANLLSLYEQALENDAVLSASIASHKATKMLKPQAWSALLPQLSVQGSDTSTYTHGLAINTSHGTSTTTYAASFALAQTLFQYSTWAGIKTSTIQIQQSQAQLESTKNALIIRLATAYFKILAAQDKARFSHLDVQAKAKHLEYAQKRFQAGLVPITDVQEAQAKYDKAKVTELSDKNDVSTQFEQLTTITGGPALAHIMPLGQDIPLTPPIPQDEESWVNNSLLNNPDLRQSQLNTILAKRQIATQRAGHLPTLSLNASILTSRTVPNNILNNYSPVDTAALTLSMPIFSGGLILAKTSQAQYQLDKANAQYEEQLRKLSAATRAGFRAVLTDIEVIQARAQQVTSQKSALDATDAAYKAGTRTMENVLDAESDLYSARKDHALARYQYILDMLTLKQQAGHITEEDLKYFNALLVPLTPESDNPLS